MLWVDVPLARYMRTFANSHFVAAFGVITHLGNSAIWYGVALGGMATASLKARANPAANAAWLRQRLRAWLFLIISLALSGLLVNGIKLVVGRGRPSDLFAKGEPAYYPMSSMTASWSFPSGHTQSIWGAMIALAWIYPPARPLCFVVAAVVSASRVIVGAHYASDVVAGAFFGIAVAYLVRDAFERRGPPIDLSGRRD
jgi:membrane-associated phospholipid phosphatase